RAGGSARSGTGPADFLYQTRATATNAPVGSANTPVDIPPGQFQTYVVGLTPTATIRPIDVQFTFACDNTAADALVIPGVNTLQLVASAGPVPDIVALAAADAGIVPVSGGPRAGVFTG